MSRKRESEGTSNDADSVSNTNAELHEVNSEIAIVILTSGMLSRSCMNRYIEY